MSCACPYTILSTMIVSCKENIVTDHLFQFYFIMENGANPIEILNLVRIYLEKAKIGGLLHKIFTFKVCYKKYYDKRKFAELYFYYKFKQNQFPFIKNLRKYLLRKKILQKSSPVKIENEK